MKLHANAALSLRQRRRMVLRVVEEGWSLTKAAAAAEVSERTCCEVGGALPGRGRARVCWIAPRRPQSVANRTDERARRGDRGAAAVAVHRPGDRRAARHAALDGLGDPARGSGWASWAGSGWSRPSATSATRPGELIHIDVKKLGRIQGGAGKRVTGGAARYTGTYTDAAGRRRRSTPAGTTCTSPSTTPPAWPTPKSSPTRRPPPRSRSCAARSRSSPATASPSSA